MDKAWRSVLNWANPVNKATEITSKKRKVPAFDILTEGNPVNTAEQGSQK